MYSEDGEFKYCFRSSGMQREGPINPVYKSPSLDSLVYFSDLIPILFKSFSQSF